MGGAEGNGAPMGVAKDRSSSLEDSARPAAPEGGGDRQSGPSTVRSSPDTSPGGDPETAPRPRVRLWDDIGAYPLTSLAETVVVIAEDRAAP